MVLESDRRKGYEWIRSWIHGYLKRQHLESLKHMLSYANVNASHCFPVYLIYNQVNASLSIFSINLVECPHVTTVGTCWLKSMHQQNNNDELINMRKTSRRWSRPGPVHPFLAVSTVLSTLQTAFID